jgi:pimeloyl-ACP methyl ester carboxylesterase
MPVAICDGIETRYETAGDGPPLLMFSPGGFNATIENWSAFGVYRRLNLLPRLREGYTCITFDKRESGRSGGRVERIGWDDYARQGTALLDHLGIERAHVIGGCIGCSVALTLAVAHPERIDSMVLYSPAGGPRYRRTQHARFAEHVAYVEQEGLAGVVALAHSHDQSFAQDPRVGPWVTVLRRDAGFADAYPRRDASEYAVTVNEMARALFDRDTVPGAEPEQLFELAIRALVVPGHDPNHATSAARYLEECLPHAEYWDVMPDEQTAENAPGRVLDFLQRSDSPRSSAAI